MIAKMSLFNKGIYKSTLKRFSWGSILYFIILFLVTIMSILLTVDREARYTRYTYLDGSYLLRNEVIIIPLLLAVVVPIAVGLLIFRYIHSKKPAVFVHSLPVKREANFISSTLAGLTLMTLPLVLNTLLLMLLSLSGYGDFFSVTDCLVWLLFNLFGIFIMFSCVCVVASITGNSFAMIVLNVLFHTVFLIIAACVSVVAEMFLYGFPNDNSVINFVAENMFPVRVMRLCDYAEQNRIISAADIIVPLIVSTVLYAVSVFLYKKRRMETAEDIAGFKCLNPIFKYLITLVIALVAFSVGYSFMHDRFSAFWAVILISSAVVYFACEMVLRKTFRVWSSYKGYCAFAGIFAVIVCIFAFTSFFGYETRIPDAEAVRSVAVYDYYSGEEPFLDNPDIIKKVIDIHREMTDEKSVLTNLENHRYFHIKYKLNNGSVIHRRYATTDEKFRDIMSKLYDNQQYKELAEEVFLDNVGIPYVYIHADSSVRIENPVKTAELLECMRKDVSNLSYDRIYNDGWHFGIDYEYVIKDKNGKTAYRYTNYNINANYKNTIAWMKENSYWSYVEIANNGVLYIVDEWNDLPFVDEMGVTSEVDPVKDANTIKLQGEDAQRMIDYIHTEGQSYMEENEIARVYKMNNNDVKSLTLLAVIPKDIIK